MAITGQRVSEYVLEDRVGAGTFGEVSRARHHVWNQLVAIKLPNDSAYIRDLQREGLAVQGLEHPNLVRAIGFDPYADPAYLVLEFIPGHSLRQIIKQGPMAPADALAVMRQVLTGLQYAHAKGIIHRDLKPENVLIHESALAKGYAAPGVVKITDFGFGQRSAPQAGSIAYSMSLGTEEARRIVGTIDYMSPEQRSGADIDARTDLFACGVILFEMLTGEKPTGTEVPSEVRKGIPNNLDEAFRRAYARIDRRFGSVEEFMAALGGSAIALPPLRQPTALARSTNELTTCARCSRSVGGKDQFCMHCGVQLVRTVRRCAHCGSYPDVDDEYCNQCGRGLTKMRLAN